MDFVVGLLKIRRQHHSIWVTVDSMTKSAYSNPVKSSYRAENYAIFDTDETVRYHQICLSIILDRGSQLSSLYIF